MPKRKDVCYWNIPVTKSLDHAVEEAIHQDMHATKADFIRDAVRRLLEQMNLYPLPLPRTKLTKPSFGGSLGEEERSCQCEEE